MTIIAVIYKNSISFFLDNDNNISFFKNYPLFFYFDKTDNSFRNSDKYKIFALENNTNTFSNIFISFTENKAINNPVAKDYSFFIKKIFSQLISLKPNYDKIEIVFSDTFSHEQKEQIFDFIAKNYKTNAGFFSISLLAAKNYILKRQLSSKKNNILILQNDENDLISTDYSFDTEKINEILSLKINDFIYQPNAFVITNNILDDIIRIYNLKTNKNKNINYIYYKILHKALEIENLPKNFVVISTKILGSEDRFSVRIETSKIKLLKQVYLKNMLATLERKNAISDDSILVLLGDLFDNQNLTEAFEDSFNHVEHATVEEVIKTRNEEFSAAQGEFSTMFLEANPQEYEKEEQIEKTSELDIQKLEIGEQVKLTNFDPRPAKGYSSQLMEYLGNNRFVVLESTRSLKTGDILETENILWKAKNKLIFTVNRNGKLYGRFQTREIQSIEILSKKS